MDEKKRSPELKRSESLSVRRNRLAGNARCLNCGTQLQGPFCHHCGQPDRNFLRFFPVLLREFMEDFLDFDSRFVRTMKPLLFQPGKLTRDYLDGKRFRYTPPLRLYVFSSIAFFFVAALLTVNAFRVEIDPAPRNGHALNIDVGEPAELKRLREAVAKLDPEAAASIDEALAEAAAEHRAAVTGADANEQITGKPDGPSTPEGSGSEPEAFGNGFMVGGKPWDPESNPVILPLMPEFVNDWINEEIAESPEKEREIEANPNLIVDKVFDVLPVTLFVILPLAALLLKFWYLFSGHYYIEHLIYALHNHAFLFIALLLSLLAGALADWVEPSGSGPVTTSVFWFNAGILCWIPIYFLISLKRVYRQGWAMTLVKYVLTGSSYTALLALATAVVALLSFVML